MSSSSPLKVGILLLSSGVQLMDVAPVDMLGMLEKGYVQACQLPEHLVAKALNIEYYFVNETGEGPNQMTGGFKVAVTHSIETCPPLDILLIGGPLPSYRPSPAVQHFVQNQYDHVRALLTICTGYIPALYSGIFEGKTATAPQGLLPMLREEKPEVKWVEKRWVRDGKVWSSGAIANGVEMMASFMREEFGEQREITETMLGLADFAKRGTVY
ncbi:MAG: hypothetical protein L6R40_005545 [Gallowayella cf. fulva]|nr:MAG: hypothetical protein L6R40_005545 [Xanthomendoza cf. fulva]